jgi:hypothetical protein
MEVIPMSDEQKNLEQQAQELAKELDDKEADAVSGGAYNIDIRNIKLGDFPIYATYPKDIPDGKDLKRIAWEADFGNGDKKPGVEFELEYELYVSPGPL